MVLLTFAIGLLNLCLGFAVAMYLGYGPPGLLQTWEAIWTAPPQNLDPVEAIAPAPVPQTEQAVSGNLPVPPNVNRTTAPESGAGSWE